MRRLHLLLPEHMHALARTARSWPGGMHVSMDAYTEQDVVDALYGPHIRSLNKWRTKMGMEKMTYAAVKYVPKVVHVLPPLQFLRAAREYEQSCIYAKYDGTIPQLFIETGIDKAITLLPGFDDLPAEITHRYRPCD